MSNPLLQQHRREIERRRRAAQCPKARLARLAGVDRQYLREVTQGKANPSLAWLGRVYAALDLAERTAPVA